MGFLRRLEDENDPWTSPCQVSNDPPDNRGFVPLQTCGIPGFSCYNPQELDPTEIPVTFSFEVHYSPEASLEGNVLPYLDENMMAYAAAAMGLDDCDNDLSVKNGSSRSLQEIGGIDASQFVGVRRNPFDEVDTSVPECNQGRPIGGLTLSMCTPVRGGFTVVMNNVNDSMLESDKENVVQSVRSFMKDAINRDLFLSRGNIQKIVYAEERSGLSVSPIPVSEVSTERSQSDGNAGFPTLWVGVIAGAGALFVAIFALLAFRKRTRNYPDAKRNTTALAEEDEIGLAAVDSLALAPQDLNESTLTAESTGSRRSAVRSQVDQPHPDVQVAESEDISYIIETETQAEDSSYSARKIYFPKRDQQPSDVVVFPSSAESDSDISISTPRQALQMS